MSGGALVNSSAGNVKVLLGSDGDRFGAAISEIDPKLLSFT